MSSKAPLIRWSRTSAPSSQIKSSISQVYCCLKLQHWDFFKILSFKNKLKSGAHQSLLLIKTIAEEQKQQKKIIIFISFQYKFPLSFLRKAHALCTSWKCEVRSSKSQIKIDDFYLSKSHTSTPDRSLNVSFWFRKITTISSRQEDLLLDFEQEVGCNETIFRTLAIPSSAFKYFTSFF